MVGVVQTMLTNYKTSGGGGGFVPPAYVSDDLILYYDPANPASYSGSGSTITDLSPNGFNGTINNATYNSTLNSGVFTFVGSAGNQYIMSPNVGSYIKDYLPPGATAYGSFSVEMWVYATANGSAVMEVGQNSISTGWRCNNIEMGTVGPFFAARGGYVNISNTTTYSGANGTPGLNKWMHLCIVHVADGAPKAVLYYNGAIGTTTNNGTRKTPFLQSPLLSGQTLDYSGWAFGAGSTQNSLALAGGTAMFTGRIGIIRAYRRGLTQTEIQTNYNAVKARYGL